MAETLKILLDTHVWLWTIVAPERIGEEPRRVIADRNNTVLLSAASSWEIAIKYALGKLPLPSPPGEFILPRLARDGIVPLPIEHAHATRVADLPGHHRDPFDRLLVAQAQVEGLTIYTADQKLAHYDVSCVLVDTSVTTPRSSPP